MNPSRRTPGLSSLTRGPLSSTAYAQHGATLRATQTAALQTQLSVFQSLLHQFSITHAKDIRSNPQFRAEFARMCSAIGVDFLAGSYKKDSSSGDGGKGGDGKGGIGGLTGNWWTQMLGPQINDFYFSLAISVVEICRATRAENGGLIPISTVRTLIQSRRNPTGSLPSSSSSNPPPANPASTEEISDSDIHQAVSSLSPLGSCITILKIGHLEMIRSVPKELNTDQSTVLEAVQVLGYVTVSMLVDNLGWGRARAVASIEDLMSESLVWVDRQAPGGENEYWSPAVIGGEGRG